MARDDSSDGTARPVYKHDLLEDAKEVQEPVTEVEWTDDDRTVRVHAIQEYAGEAYRVMIKSYEPSDTPPRVKFARCHWDEDARVLQDWSSLATGRLSGPQDLPAWESLFTVFNAALGQFNREVRDADGAERLTAGGDE